MQKFINNILRGDANQIQVMEGEEGNISSSAASPKRKHARCYSGPLWMRIRTCVM